MPSIPIRTDIAANAELDLMNQPNARQYATLPFNARIRWALFADTGDVIDGGVFVGGAISQPTSQLPNQAVATPPTILDLVGQDVGFRGDTVSIPVVDRSGAVSTIHGLVEIIPVP